MQLAWPFYTCWMKKKCVGANPQLPEKNPEKLASFSACRLQCSIFAQLSFVTALGARVLWLLRDVLEREEKVHLLSATLTPCTPSGARTHQFNIIQTILLLSAAAREWVQKPARGALIAGGRRVYCSLLAFHQQNARALFSICNWQLINCKCTRTSGETETRLSAPCKTLFLLAARHWKRDGSVVLINWTFF